MRIAHVLGSLGMGGAERVALDLAVVQRELGHDLRILVLSEPGGPMQAQFECEALPMHFLPKGQGIDWRLPAKVGRYLRKEKVEVAHTHNTGPLVYATAAARLAGLRVVHTKHGEGHLQSRASKILRTMGAPFAHHFVAVSEATARHAREQRAYPFADRLSVIENGIRLDLFHSNADAKRRARTRLCEELGIEREALIVGSIGRVDDNKNHVFLLDLLEAMSGSAQGRALHLVIAGDGEAMPLLRERATHSKYAEQIALLGRRSDAPELLAGFDLFALPSKSEGLPLVILEAMASRTPIVSNAVGGIPRVIDDADSGRLLRTDDLVAWRSALEEVSKTPARGEAWAAAALQRVARDYSARRMAERYLELYR